MSSIARARVGAAEVSCVQLAKEKHYVQTCLAGMSCDSYPNSPIGPLVRRVRL